jgi:hypothetical protein
LQPVLLFEETTFLKNAEVVFTSKTHWQQADQWNITGIKNSITFQVVIISAYYKTSGLEKS